MAGEIENKVDFGSFKPVRVNAFRGLLFLLLSVQLSASERPRIPLQWLIVYKDDIPRADLHASFGSTLLKRFAAIQADLVSFPPGVDEAALAQRYRQNPLVSSVEPNGIVEKLSPNDELYPLYEPWYDQIRATQAFDAWAAGQIVLKDTVTVAVIDTGASAHPDLAAQLLPGANFVANETNSDLEGHGSFVAGIIAAATSNTAGIAGVFFDPSRIRILPVKILDAGGHGTDDQLASGLIYAADQGVRVINLSLGENFKSDAVRKSVNYARNKGIFIVAAAGNNFGDAVFFPAAFPNVFAVSAVDASDQVAPYSNWGRIDLAAPGGISPAGSSPCLSWPISDTHTADVWSLCNGVTPKYRYGSGTSYAAPMVAAAAALLLSQNYGRSAEDLYRILTQSADSTAHGIGYHPETGWGRLNVYRALTYAGGPAAGYFGGKIKVYNWPNPFNPSHEGSCNLTFFLERPAAAVIHIRDLAGDLLFQKNLDAAATMAGMNIVPWDGKNGQGREASNGTYLLTVEADGKKGNNRIMILR